MRFSPDDRLLATAARDNTACLWEVATGKLLRRIAGHTEWVYDVAFSPDGAFLGTSSMDRTARVWEVETGREIPPAMRHGDAVRAVRFSPDGRRIATVAGDRTLRGVASGHAPARGRNQPPAQQRPRPIHRLRPGGTQDRRRLVRWHDPSLGLGGSDVETQRVGQAHLERWGLRTPRRGRRARHPRAGDKRGASGEETLRLGSWSEPSSPPDARGIATEWADDSGRSRLRFLDARTGSDSGTSAAIVPDARLADWHLSPAESALLFLWTTNAQLWNLRSGKPLSDPISFSNDLTWAVFSADGRRLFVSEGTRLHTWDARTCRPIAPPIQYPAILRYFAFDANEERYVTCLSNPSWSNLWAQVWDAKTRRPISPLLRHDDGVLYAAFSPDGEKVATCGEDFTARIWDIASGKLLTEPLLHDGQVHRVAFSRDGKWLLTAGGDHVARLWDVETGEPISPPLVNPDELEFAQILEDPYRLRVARRRGAVSQCWEWTLAKDARSIEEWQDLAFLFSPSVSSARQIAPEDPTETIHKLKATWERLKARDPTLFATTAVDARAWHEQEAAAAQEANDSFGAAFHQAYLRKPNPTH